MGSRKSRPRGADGRWLAGSGDGGGERRERPKRATPQRGWTKQKEAIFFRELTAVCNVSAALRKAGLTTHSSTLYERRKSNAAFRAKWDEAIGESYALLELEMMERARFGASRPEPETAVEKRLREIPDGLALQLLKLHQGRSKSVPAVPGRRAAAIAPAEGMALRRELDAILSEFNRRMGGKG